ncbi:MAG: geranylgeranylglycerol-phosphate geranylgeranyltransferase [Candidatus Promineifilaceae bacterium]|nr:geranylgeranylglycerol-phosphate geranylgeranyltransferase [Candidatus Promineifilaceae bacterium]
MIRQIKGMYKLARPFNALSGALAVFMGGYVAGTGEWVKVLLAGLVVLLVTSAGNAWNDYLDVEIDRINQPHRVLPSGLIRPRMAVLFSLVLNILALLVAYFINWPAFLITFFSILALYLYSWKLKSTVLMGNMTVATTSAMTVIFGGTAAGNVRPTLWLAIIIMSGILGREVLKTIADYEGDLRQQCRTIATVWGKRAARIVFYIVTGVTVWVMMVPYLVKLYQDRFSLCSIYNICERLAPPMLVEILPVYRPIYAYIVAFGVFPVIAYVILSVKRDVPGRQLERLSQLLKYDFLVWFAAVLLGATG